MHMPTEVTNLANGHILFARTLTSCSSNHAIERHNCHSLLAVGLHDPRRIQEMDFLCYSSALFELSIGTANLEM